MTNLVTYALSQAQKRIMNTEILYPDTNISILAGMINFEEDVNEYLLNRALNLFISQNDTLRIQLSLQQGEEFRQYFVPHTDLKFEILDFSQSMELLDKWIAEETGKPFQLLDSPLFSFAIIKQGNHKGSIYMKLHHVIADGISMNLLVTKVTEIYRKLVNNEDIIDGKIIPT